MDQVMQKEQNLGRKKQMAAVEKWLRPLVVNNKNMWDYCVIWKLGDDPSRFIEWGACCCSGGKKVETNWKINGENSSYDVVLCKDSLNKHPVRSSACRALARLPSDIPLYSGIHGDVVISKQPRWVLHGGTSASDAESNGTQVLIPVACGLIELFSTKHVPKDQKTIDYIVSCFKNSAKQENMPETDPYSIDFLETLSPLLHPLSFPPPISQPNTYSSFDGSSTCSSLSNELQSLKIVNDRFLGRMSPEKASAKFIASPKNSLKLKRKMDTDFELGYGSEKVCAKIKQKPEKQPYKSKNLMTERNRRKRIKDGILALRALVPKISKMDRAATLDDAADYIKELEETIANYHVELREMEEEDHRITKTKTNVPKKNPSSASELTPTEVKVEVTQIETKDFLLKLVCKKREEGFSKLMEAMDDLGLKVIDVNVTTLQDSVLINLRVEANSAELESKTLKHLLMKLIN